MVALYNPVCSILMATLCAFVESLVRQADPPTREELVGNFIEDIILYRLDMAQSHLNLTGSLLLLYIEYSLFCRTTQRHTHTHKKSDLLPNNNPICN
ncbi:MAG: hypothetical protein BYD32DRAFT_428611 [Podila humilis]|nr:MAG: hypothetical protein BYD32DRAFT_428611 [Podila humilis]